MKLIEKTIRDILLEGALDDRPAIEVEGFCCTWKGLDRFSDILAVRMDRAGISKGSHVGIWSVNSPNWVITFLALVKLGAVPVLFNTCYKEEEIKGIINYSDISFMYYGHSYKTIIYRDIIEKIRPETPGVKAYISIDEIGEYPSVEGFDADEIEGVSALKEKFERVSCNDPACMIFTSGTTNLPKGVLLSHYNIINNARAMIENMHWNSEDKMCITVPMFHCFGITAGIISCILSGASMHIIPYFKTRDVWATLKTYDCSIMNGVPSMFMALIRKPGFKDFKYEGLKSGIIAGSPLLPEEYAEICTHFPNMKLQPSYGQTEASPCISIAGWDMSNEKKAMCAGRAIDNIELRIAALPGAAGNEGEIQVRGYNTMLGYYKLDRVNAGAFTEDGWLKTGDIGYIDDEGCLHISGRLKEMIIRAGENISPFEIEIAIRSLSEIEEVKVVGVPAEVLQEEIAACIILKEGALLDDEDIIEYLTPRLAHYKIPSYIFRFKEFPMNASGKIDLKSLRKTAAEMAEKMNKS